MDSWWGRPLLAKSPQQYPSSHMLGFRDAAVLGGGAGAQISPKGGPKHTSNRITSLRMTAEIRSKSLSYCVTRDSHCGDRKCAVWGQEKELLIPSPWGSGATAVHVRGAAGAELSPSSPCHHPDTEVTAGRTTSSPSCSLTQGWLSPCCSLARQLSLLLRRCAPAQQVPSPAQQVPHWSMEGRNRAETPRSIPYLRDLILGLLQLVGFVCPQQPGLHLPLLLEHGLGILPPLPGLHALVKGSLEGRRGRGLLTR